MPLAEDDGEDASRGSSEFAKLVRDVLTSPLMTKNATQLVRELFWPIVLVVVCVCADLMLIVAHVNGLAILGGTAGTGAVGVLTHRVRSRWSRRKKQKDKARRSARKATTHGRAGQRAKVPKQRADQDSTREDQR